jgi:pyruvate kinase
VRTEDTHDLDSDGTREGFDKHSERIVITAGVPLGTSGPTNLLRVAFVGGK